MPAIMKWDDQRGMRDAPRFSCTSTSASKELVAGPCTKLRQPACLGRCLPHHRFVTEHWIVMFSAPHHRPAASTAHRPRQPPLGTNKGSW